MTNPAALSYRGALIGGTALAGIAFAMVANLHPGLVGLNGGEAHHAALGTGDQPISSPETPPTAAARPAAAPKPPVTTGSPADEAEAPFVIAEADEVLTAPPPQPVPEAIPSRPVEALRREAASAPAPAASALSAPVGGGADGYGGVATSGDPSALALGAPSTSLADSLGASAPTATIAPASERALSADRLRLAPSGDAPAPGFQEQGRDRFEPIADNPVKVTAEAPVSTFSIDVDTASYSVMRTSLNQGVLPQKDAIRVEELINYFDYAYDGPDSLDTPFATHVAIFDTPWNADTKLIRIGLKGYELTPEERPRANLVFLIDTSGSMNAPDKLPLLLNAFRLLLDRLDEDDRVSIVTYAGSAGTVLEPTPASEKGKILAALDRLSAGGSTAGGEGIRQAYALAEANLDPEGVNRVILATDGDFNVGIRSTEELQGFVERKRATGVLLSVLGFGRGNYNDALMQALAQNGNGQAAFIDTLSEARKVLGEEASGTLFPIAQDVKIQMEFNPAQISEYRLIGYETRALAREDFNNDRVDAGEIGSGHRVTALYEITPVGSPARLVDGLRYGAPQPAPEATEAAISTAQAAEFAFLRLRYKRPGEGESRLIERPITAADEGAPDVDARFAAAVAGFGQLLRGARHTGDWDYSDASDLANGARGQDPFGYRAEFVQLVRLAETAAALERQR
ncbi:MAG: von Willebrand factor type A domain-containing protein [Pikeienuella sp.]